MDKLIKECDSKDIIKRQQLSNDIINVRIKSCNTKDIMKELSNFGLIEFIDKQNIKINKSDYQKYIQFEID